MFVDNEGNVYVFGDDTVCTDLNDVRSIVYGNNDKVIIITNSQDLITNRIPEDSFKINRTVFTVDISSVCIKKFYKKNDNTGNVYPAVPILPAGTMGPIGPTGPTWAIGPQDHPHNTGAVIKFNPQRQLNQSGIISSSWGFSIILLNCDGVAKIFNGDGFFNGLSFSGIKSVASNSRGNFLLHENNCLIYFLEYDVYGFNIDFNVIRIQCTQNKILFLDDENNIYVSNIIKQNIFLSSIKQDILTEPEKIEIPYLNDAICTNYLILLLDDEGKVYFLSDKNEPIIIENAPLIKEISAIGEKLYFLDFFGNVYSTNGFGHDITKKDNLKNIASIGYIKNKQHTKSARKI